MAELGNSGWPLAVSRPISWSSISRPACATILSL